MKGSKAFVSGIGLSILLLFLLVPQACASAYKWVDENGETHFGDRVPQQYRGHRQQIGTRSDKAQRNDLRAAESPDARYATPEYGTPSQFSDKEWEQRIREMEARRSAAEENARTQALKPRKPQPRYPEAKTAQEQYEEFKALQRKTQQDNAKRYSSRKKREQPKTYEQQMEAYKASRNCFDMARNINGTINAAMVDRLGCKNVKRPRR